MSAKGKDKTIFREMLLPLLSVLVIQILFMAGIILMGGVIARLNQNAVDMLIQRTENRGDYLLNEMIGNWSNLELLSEEIDQKVQDRLNQGLLTIGDLGEGGGESVELLKDISPELINTMYNKQVSGIFVMLNTKNLEGSTAPQMISGIYLRDLDPDSMPSQKNADLLWERAPVSVVQSGHIATDSGWQPAFSKEDLEQSFFCRPFQAAYKDNRELREKEYGYWTAVPYCLSGDNRTAISYSIPLILEDGTVYGVLGVELLTDYVKSFLPAAELLEDRQGSYVLAVDPGEDQHLIPVILSSDTMEWEQFQAMGFRLWEEGGAADAEGKYYAAARKMVLYSNHAPFDADKWYLLGISSKKSLFAFSRQIQTVLVLAMVLTFIIGFVGIVLASYRLSRPIQRLSKEVERAQSDNRIPVLSVTGIREIDQFAGSISRLGQEVVESSTRLLSIMDMASVELAGYEIQEESGSVYVTDNYFSMMDAAGIDVGRLTPETFRNYQKKLHESLEHKYAEDGSVVYSVPQSDGTIRYLRFEQQKKDGRHIGLMEDVTAFTLERMRIERERDSDGLTKLYARRGFRREADELFLKPQVLKHAALIMIDLDNLKTTNDRYGHNVGDQYIQTAGKCFVENTPPYNTLCARMSGDEFTVLIYGYDSREEVREKVEALYDAIHTVDFVLPNGDNMGISASGGVAWYPEDSTQLSELMKYADFAMYQVKRSQKGEYREFEREVFKEQQLQNQSKLDFHQVLETRNVNYFFQPIYECKSGRIFAYEALMRVNLPAMRSPETVLRLAREEGCMHEIECLTLFRSAECYDELLKKGMVSKEALLFVNSIANESMTLEEEALYHERFGHFQERVVVEITEAEHMDMELIRQKSRTKGFSGMFALDDYGSGYNSEINLLELNPKFVKVDISIVRDVDKDANKQQIIRNIVDYGHKRDMVILAEGIETLEELTKVLELGVDLLQGYYLARPGEVPPEINKDALKVIQEYQEKQNRGGLHEQ